MSEPPAEDPWPNAPIVPQNPYPAADAYPYPATPGAPPARRKRTKLLILGVTLAVLAGVITIGALTRGSDGDKPTDSQAAATAPAGPAPADSAPSANDDEGALDPRFETCEKANDAGYGPYHEGADPEYAWYRDRDKDGTVCEK
jgi:hypothetical protein